MTNTIYQFLASPTLLLIIATITGGAALLMVRDTLRRKEPLSDTNSLEFAVWILSTIISLGISATLWSVQQ